jgi:DNA-binding winged helix-turn-helix (wHTH) protein/Tol biopolymer transport system component
VASERYEFGPFRLDCRTRELSRGDTVIPLTPKAFDLLRALVTAADSVVEKDALLKLVWPDSFVSEDSLTQQIALLRRTLGEGADRPQYILTVPRHGYRFIAEVRSVGAKPHDPAMSTPFDSFAGAPSVAVPANMLGASRAVVGRTKWWWLGFWVVVPVVTILIAAAFGWRMFSAPASSRIPEVLRFTISPPDGTTFSASASFVAVSPNGRLLAFLAYRPGEETRIWVRSLDSLQPHELMGTDGARGPFWSPDSLYLGFVAGDQLKTVGVLGQPPRTLCHLEGGNTPSGTWSRDGIILFSNGSVISRISARGGAPAAVTVVDAARGEKAHSLPLFLPDGRHFIYLASGSAGGSINSWNVLGSLDKTESQPLIRATSQALYADPGYLLFLQNGALFAQPFDRTRFQIKGAAQSVSGADQVGFNPNTPRGMFTVSETGLLAYRISPSRELGWFDRKGAPLGWLGEAGRDSNPALSPDGRRIAVSRYDPITATRAVWILDLDHAGMASSVMAASMWANCPIWSPDGARLVFASGGNASATHLYEKDLAGSTDARMLAQHTNACPLDWSRDGRFVLYGTSRDAGVSESSLWLITPGGEATPKPVLGPWPRRVWAHISPNGRWMTYVSDASGRNEVYVRSFPPTESTPRRVSSSGGIDPQWRADGRELFFIGADQKLMAVPVTTEGDLKVDAPTALFKTDLDPTGLGISGRNQYVVSADGMRFLLNQARPDAPPSPIVVVTNWQSSLGAAPR